MEARRSEWEWRNEEEERVGGELEGQGGEACGGGLVVQSASWRVVGRGR